METFLERWIYLESRNVDFMGRWRADEIFVEMQEVAAEHSTALGVGFAALRAKNLAWVLTRVRLEMNRYPRIGERVRVRTAVAPGSHGIYPRQFAFYSPDGAQLGAASTLWALIDLTARRMANPAALDIPALPGDPAPGLPLPGAARMPDAPAVESVRDARYTDLDVNGHVGNTRYIGWLLDALGVDVLRDASVKSLTANYAREIRPGARAALSLYRLGDQFGLTAAVDGVPRFSAAGALDRGLA